MDWGKSFTYVFDDQDWLTKILIGGILSLIPVVNLVVIGYALRALKNVAEGAERPLPAWDDFGDYFVKGLISTLGAMVWALPIIIAAGIGATLTTITGYDTSHTTRVSAPAWLTLCMWGVSCVSGIWGLLLGFVLPAALTKYAIRGDFGAFFRLGEIFSYIKANIGNYIIAVLLGWVAQFVAGFGMILCFIGVLFTEFWASLVGSHLLGQVYRGRAEALLPEQGTEPTL